MKTFTKAVLILFLALPLTGCFTKYYSQGVIDSSYDWFVPRTLYKSSVDGSIAVGGILSHQRTTKNAFLIIPKEVLLRARSQTQTNQVSLSEIRSLSLEDKKKLSLQSTLPAYYELVTNFSSEQGGMGVNPKQNVNLSAAGVLPFVFVLDVATFPLQLWFQKSAFKGLDIN